MVPPEDMEEYTPSEPPKAEEMEIEGQEMSSPRGDVQKGVKRDADVSTEELEKEIRSEPKDIEYLQDLQWSATSMPLCITASHADGSDLTSPDFYVTSMNSIKFEPGKEHVMTRIRIGGGHVLVWKPDEVIDDSTLDNLNVDQGYRGMLEEETEEMITKAIAAVVPVKVTGQILPGDEGGGELDFLGRKIYKSPKADQLAMYVSPSYLDSSFAEYDIKKGSQAAPDVAAQLEKTDEASGQRLSPEAYQRFRRCLGRLLWLSQSRQEIKLWLSLIGVKQADPTQSTEAALRAVMRYLLGHRQVSLVFPSPQFPIDHVEKDLLGIHIHGYCDASHGPYRFNMRKSISGEVLTFEQGLIRTAAKQQRPVALSSCEAETYALQAACQSATSLAKLVKRIMVGLGEASDTDQVMTVMLTDSASAQQLIQGIDIPR
ncbi:unnamed protein product, partial [Durusdinium trenchii]